MAKSRLNLSIEFDATAETDPLAAIDIANRIATYIAVELDAANVEVNVESGFLDYREGYEARKAEYAQAVKDALS